ncbi:MAG: LysR substrate-binding domain-containing protein [Propionivibrio sp.]
MAHNSLQDIPPTESLLAALEAARLGSFSAAAAELGITHAAVSRRVALVEEWTGVRLFERHGRGVMLTPNGQRVVARVRGALEQIAILGHSGAKARVPVVRVAVTPSFARLWLFPRLKAIEGELPDVRIEVVADLKHANLASGEVDLAVRYGRGGWRVGAEQRLFDETLVPVIAPTLLAEAKGPVTAIRPDDVLKWPLLHDADPTNWRAWSETHCGRSLATKPSDRVFLDYGLAFAAAANGLGVVLWTPELHALPAGLLALNHLCSAGPLTYYLLRRTGDSRSPAALVAERMLVASQEPG